jgi:flagellar biosynthesis/type III secretory pathway M-ring protein FliF/YscJ
LLNWVKTTMGALFAAIVAGLAIFAASRHKANAQKWQEQAVDIEEGNVRKKTVTAEAATTRAKLHDAKADEIVKKAENRIKDNNEATADILKRWG